MPITPYITLDQLRAYLQQTKPGTEHDATLTDICARATSIVNGALGFVYADYTAGTRRVRAYSSDWLFLPPYEPGSVTSVLWGTYTVPTSDYEEDSEQRALVRTNTGFGLLPLGSWGTATYTVTANWGYGPPPESIVEVTLEVAVNIWRSKERGGFTELVGTEGGGATVRAIQGLNKQQQAMIEAEKARFRGPLAL